MTFRYPQVVWAGLISLLVLYALLRIVKRRGFFRRGLKVANAEYVNTLATFRSAKRIHLVSSVFMELFLIAAIIASIVLAGRPYKRETINQGVRKRDIFLCMDVGIYLDTLNEELLDEMIELVRGLNGDRFGVSIYSSMTLLYVPMTDDYDYVIKKLEDLKDYFRLIIKLDQEYGAYGFNLPYALPDSLQATWDEDYNRYLDLSAEIADPTYLGRYRKGHFLVGDGLASCMYSFPKFGAEDRSRIILLSTENTNDIDGKPLVNLDEACDLCKKNRVTVFGLFRGKAAFEQSAEPNNVFIGNLETENDYETAKSELEKNVAKTSGAVYEYGVMSVNDIITDIRKQPAMLVDEVVVNKDVDQPALPAAVLLLSLIGIAVCGSVRGA